MAQDPLILFCHNFCEFPIPKTNFNSKQSSNILESCLNLPGFFPLAFPINPSQPFRTHLKRRFATLRHAADDHHPGEDFLPGHLQRDQRGRHRLGGGISAWAPWPWGMGLPLPKVWGRFWGSGKMRDNGGLSRPKRGWTAQKNDLWVPPCFELCALDLPGLAVGRWRKASSWRRRLTAFRFGSRLKCLSFLGRSNSRDLVKQWLRGGGGPLGQRGPLVMLLHRC